MPDQKPFSDISPREMQIIEMASAGLIDKEIARRLTLSMATIRTHWVRIRSKLGAVNRAEVIARVMNYRLHSDANPDTVAHSDHSRRALCESALDHHPEGVLIADLEGKILYANRAAASMLGKEIKDVEGENLDGWVRLMTGGLSKILGNVHDSGNEMTVVGTLSGPGQRASLTMRPSPQNGVVHCALRTHSDATPQPRTERKLANHQFELR